MHLEKSEVGALQPSHPLHAQHSRGLMSSSWRKPTSSTCLRTELLSSPSMLVLKEWYCCSASWGLTSLGLALRRWLISESSCCPVPAWTLHESWSSPAVSVLREQGGAMIQPPGILLGLHGHKRVLEPSPAGLPQCPGQRQQAACLAVFPGLRDRRLEQQGDSYASACRGKCVSAAVHTGVAVQPAVSAHSRHTDTLLGLVSRTRDPSRKHLAYNPLQRALQPAAGVHLPDQRPTPDGQCCLASLPPSLCCFTCLRFTGHCALTGGRGNARGLGQVCCKAVGREECGFFSFFGQPACNQHQVTAARPPPAVLVCQFPPTGTDPPFPYPAPQW